MDVKGRLISTVSLTKFKRRCYSHTVELVETIRSGRPSIEAGLSSIDPDPDLESPLVDVQGIVEEEGCRNRWVGKL